MATKQNKSIATTKQQQAIGRLLFKVEKSLKTEQTQHRPSNWPQMPKYAWH